MVFFNEFLGKKDQSALRSSPTQARVVKLPDIGQVRVSTTVDCMGETCPRPLLLTKKALRDMEDGQVLEVVVDNSISIETIPVILPELLGKHLITVRNDGSWTLYIQKIGKSGDAGHDVCGENGESAAAD
ncbi:MAG: hypothetical protein IEMM0002_0533 [bacterium]|nr:MAG: hypothetical protein IEMM0002_0533 [bacterium]